MDRIEITAIARMYHSALINESNAEFSASDARANLEVLAAQIIERARADGSFEDKNDGGRKRQRLIILASHEEYQDVKRALLDLEEHVAIKKAARRRIEVHIGLEKALLHSQSGGIGGGGTTVNVAPAGRANEALPPGHKPQPAGDIQAMLRQADALMDQALDAMPDQDAAKAINTARYQIERAVEFVTAPKDAGEFSGG